MAKEAFNNAHPKTLLHISHVTMELSPDILTLQDTAFVSRYPVAKATNSQCLQCQDIFFFSSPQLILIISIYLELPFLNNQSPGLNLAYCSMQLKHLNNLCFSLSDYRVTTVQQCARLAIQKYAFPRHCPNNFSNIPLIICPNILCPHSIMYPDSESCIVPDP